MTDPQPPEIADKEPGLTSGRFPSVDLFAEACLPRVKPEAPATEADDVLKQPT